MTAASIGAAKAGGYARYLESKTVVPERGDYYLSPEGEPTQAPGKWIASPETLARLGIEGSTVEGRDFIALMDGRHPRTGAWLRPEGAGGGRGGGIDLTFSAPKSVSAIWALGDESQRRDVEAAHAAAVSEAMAHLTETVPTVRRRYGGEVVEEPAVDLIAAEYRHTIARGVMEGDAPDPQLHSHVVVTSAIRDDGRIVAVASRPIFRSARELGSYYRSALALSKRMISERRVLPLHGGLMTTLTVRAREQAIERRFTRLAVSAERDVGQTARIIACEQVADRIGGKLSDEQVQAQQRPDLARLRAGISLAQNRQLVLGAEPPPSRPLDQLGVGDPHRRGTPGGPSVALAYGSLHSAAAGSVLLHVQHRVVLRSRPQSSVIP